MDIKTKGLKMPDGNTHIFVPPSPTETERGGIKAKKKTIENVEVVVGDDDKLYVPEYPSKTSDIVNDSGFISKPDAINVGQIFAVKSINEDGTLVLEAIDKPVDGTTPHIGDNGHWYIGDTDTGVDARGTDGITPHIGENGHWWIGDVDTGVDAGGGGAVAELKSDIATKLPKSPSNWEPWTVEEQAAARARMGIGEYELIEEVVLEEDITELVRKVDLNGNPYKFKKMVITIESVENSATNSYLSIYNEFNGYAQINLGYLSNTGKVISTQVLEIITDKVQLWYTTPTNNSRNIDTVATKAPTTLLGSDYKNICGLKYNGSFKAGSVFKIYGVRA